MSKEYTNLLEAAKAYAKALDTLDIDAECFERIQHNYVSTMFDCGGYPSLPAEIQKEIILIFLKR